MKTDVRDFRYRIGDMLGDYAPDSFRRRRSASRWTIGLGGLFAALGISYLATRIADGRMKGAIDSMVPRGSGSVHDDRSPIHGFEGRRTADAELSGMASR